MSSLHILDSSPLSDMFMNIFSYSVHCLFMLWMVSFAVQKFFSLMQSHLFIFAFVAFSFGVNPKSKPRSMSRSLLPLFSSRCFMVSGLMFKSYNLFWVTFCVLWKIQVQFQSFACDYTTLPTPLIEETVLSHCIFLAWHHKLNNRVNMYLFLGFIYCSTDLWTCFYANAILL